MTLNQAKEIAYAFGKYVWKNPTYTWEIWIETEEGKRLTAEEENEEEVKWLRAAMETQYEAYEALAKETAAGIKALNEKLDRMEGNMKIESTE